MESKQPFDFVDAIRKIHHAVKPFPKAALFELRDRGYRSPLEQLIACIISIRTRDEVTIPTSERVFRKARTPGELRKLSVEEIDQLIRGSTFHYGKAKSILKIAQELSEKQPSCDRESLLKLHGVGPKCANLVLGVACNQPFIAVDIHVHRITNRWGVVRSRTPEQTLVALQKILPRKYWIRINSLLVPFGKHVCTASKPRCSSCPVLRMCQQVGVTQHR